MNSVTLQLIKAALWKAEIPTEEITEKVFQELQEQTISILCFDVLEKCNMGESLRNRWTMDFAKQVSKFAVYIEAQNRLINDLKDLEYIPVILKGLSATQYYPEPAYRAVGDIDFLLFPHTGDDLNQVTALLQAKGYKVGGDNGRHIEFSKNGISFELHRYFSRTTTQGEIELDNIIKNSTAVERTLKKWSQSEFYSFADEVNGVIFLQHINQHLSPGLGFRQIVDWAYYVENVVTDEFWEQKLKPLTERTGLTVLAESITRMCEIYLGAPRHSWAQKADKKTCERLFRLVDEAGNFGFKKSRKDKQVTDVLANGVGFRALQARGLRNWPAAQKHKILRPFAWLYQIGRYIKKGLFERDKNSEGLWASYKRHKEQDRLFKKLGLWKYRK